eukprot:gnl/MRDRNA2_/MRDRNA2_91011_c0_seq1.p1 gnl/MRDRNA2_/MRDRNA2_91011_c0~~gnl/MRDRNA2_/MRDRNA2_91011_c0_seq1.p1  ORF type:complete len:373 (+),score=87.13 gnl/MRDRNA2_/MRDRNA2_91011_c0_seq1:91-1209(+)
MRWWSLAVLLISGASGVLRRLRDVPDGECYSCEVTCFEDCALKFDREIVQMESFLQTQKPEPTAEKLIKGYVVELREDGKNKKKCKKQRGCDIANRCVQSFEKDMGSIEDAKTQEAYLNTIDRGLEHPTGKNWAKDRSALEASTIDIPDFHAPDLNAKRSDASSEPSPEKYSNFEDMVDQNHKSLHPSVIQANTTKGKILPLEGTRESFYPVHPVKIGVFGQGKLNMHKCLTFCLSSTCGCPGITDISGEVAAENAALGHPVKDTKPTWHHRKAKKEECTGKVTKGMYVDFAPGVGGWLEVCSDKFWYYAFQGDSADTRLHEAKKKCKDETDMEYGCVWNDVRGDCEVGVKGLREQFGHSLKCFTRYKRDKA